MAKEKKAMLDLSGMTDIAEVIATLRSRYGDNTLILGSEAKGVKMAHVSTGSYALDIALGGGLPQNRIIEFRGQFSSFKSTISLTGAACFQKKHPTGFVVYIDLEKSFDADYAQKLGVDLDRLILINPDSGEQSINVLNDLMTSDFDLWIILDSVAALVPSAEIEGQMEDQFMGLQARLVNRAMRVVNSRLKRSLYDEKAPTTTLIALNQLRQKIGVVYGNPETTPGGLGKDFFYSVIIRFQSSTSNAIKGEVTNQGVKRTVLFGQLVTFKIMKNKCGGPQHEEGEFVFYYKDHEDYKAQTFANHESLFTLGVFHGVISVGSFGFKFQHIVAKRERDFIKRLKGSSPALTRMLYTQLIQKVNPKLKPALKFKAADTDEDDE
jgi:recombination protein RecA